MWTHLARPRKSTVLSYHNGRALRGLGECPGSYALPSLVYLMLSSALTTRGPGLALFGGTPP